MSLLLVDDRDGRIVAELENQDEIQRVLEAWVNEDQCIPEHFCIVELAAHPGAIVGTQSSVKIRPLT